MPAAAPQATISRRRGTGALRQRPISEPARAASCTIGPSRPIAPPVDTVAADDNARSSEGRTPRSPAPSAIASM